MNDQTIEDQRTLKKDQQERVMRQMFSGLVAAFAVVTVSAAPAMACGGGGLFTSPCSPCGQAYVSPCGSSYHAGYGYAGYGRYQRLADPSPRYYWVNQGPVYDGPGQFAPRPYYRERVVTGWRGHHGYRGHYGYTGGPYANPINHYSYGGVVSRGPAITSYRWRHARPAHLRYGYRHAARPSVRYGHAPRHGYAVRHGASRMVSTHVNRAPRFRDSGSYSYRSGFHHGPRAHRH
jgi:hypothetical protein